MKRFSQYLVYLTALVFMKIMERLGAGVVLFVDRPADPAAGRTGPDQYSMCVPGKGKKRGFGTFQTLPGQSGVDSLRIFLVPQQAGENPGDGGYSAESCQGGGTGGKVFEGRPSGYFHYAASRKLGVLRDGARDRFRIQDGDRGADTAQSVSGTADHRRTFRAECADHRVPRRNDEAGACDGKRRRECWSIRM
mgnify:CR=1 FL=1